MTAATVVGATRRACILLCTRQTRPQIQRTGWSVGIHRANEAAGVEPPAASLFFPLPLAPLSEWSGRWGKGCGGDGCRQPLAPLFYSATAPFQALLHSRLDPPHRVWKVENTPHVCSVCISRTLARARPAAARIEPLLLPRERNQPARDTMDDDRAPRGRYASPPRRCALAEKMARFGPYRAPDLSWWGVYGGESHITAAVTSTAFLSLHISRFAR